MVSFQVASMIHLVTTFMCFMLSLMLIGIVESRADLIME